VCQKRAESKLILNIHVCVIDDCSDDQDSVQLILEKIAGKPFIDQEVAPQQLVWRSPSITYVQLLKDEGSYRQAHARNRGMEVCWNDTDYFAILDADDENYPTKIERCVQVMKENKVAAAYTDTNIVQVENNRMVREYREPFDYFRLMQECIVHSGCVIKKDALASVLENGRVFDEDLPPCEDYDLWVRLAEKYLFIHIPEPLVYVRVHPQNSTNTSTHEHRMSRIQRIFQKRTQRLR